MYHNNIIGTRLLTTIPLWLTRYLLKCRWSMSIRYCTASLFHPFLWNVWS